MPRAAPSKVICIAWKQRDAIQHIFRVASSLESMVVGEPQILGQMKAAYAVAQKEGCPSAVCLKTF